MERQQPIHIFRAEQGRARERFGVAQHSQDAARTAAHHAAVIGSLMGTVSAGAVGAAVGMGRHLFAAGRQTWESQRAVLSAPTLAVSQKLVFDFKLMNTVATH